MLEEQDFISKCKKELPEFLIVNKKLYKLYANITIDNTYRISYTEFNGIFFNWKNNPIHLSYRIVHKLPFIKKHQESLLKDATNYVSSIEEIISDCILKLKSWHNNLYTIPSNFELKETAKNTALNSDFEI